MPRKKHNELKISIARFLKQPAGSLIDPQQVIVASATKLGRTSFMSQQHLYLPDDNYNTTTHLHDTRQPRCPATLAFAMPRNRPLNVRTGIFWQDRCNIFQGSHAFHISVSDIPWYKGFPCPRRQQVSILKGTAIRCTS
jgi:hypothetical protein